MDFKTTIIIARKLKVPVGRWIACIVFGAGFIIVGIWLTILLIDHKPSPKTPDDLYLPLIFFGLSLWILARWHYWPKIKSFYLCFKEERRTSR